MPASLTNLDPARRAELDAQLARVKLYKLRHPERVREQSKRTYIKLHDKALAAKHRYDEANRERQRAYARKYHEEHREQEMAYRRSVKQQVNERTKKWCRKAYHSDPAYKIRRLLTTKLWKALHRVKGTKSDSIRNMVGCSFTDLKAHLEAQFTAGMSWDRMGEIHIDHIRPCASFDLTDPEQQKACFHYSNLQPLWALDNQVKHAKWDGGYPNGS